MISAVVGGHDRVFAENKTKQKPDQSKTAARSEWRRPRRIRVRSSAFGPTFRGRGSKFTSNVRSEKSRVCGK